MGRERKRKQEKNIDRTCQGNKKESIHCNSNVSNKGNAKYAEGQLDGRVRKLYINSVWTNLF